MKTKKIFLALSLLVSVGLLTQCEKYGDRGGGGTPDDDSDRPEWAGGNTDDNIHSKGNDDSGTTRGGDYGDLYVLFRDLDNSGVPELVEIDGEYYVQPLDVDGYIVERYSAENTEDEELWGELIDPTAVIEVDFGRLNIVRSPTSVLDQAYEEALKVLDPDNADLHPVTISLDFCGRLTSHYFNEDLGEYVDKTIDSPRENMAIYRTIMQGLDPDDMPSYLAGLNPLSVAASCFAAGSDKTGTVDVDEMIYINGFMNCYGNSPIINEDELDFEGNPKQYYNFHAPLFEYNREETYNNRYIQFNVWDGVYDPGNPDNIFSIWEVFEYTGFDWKGIGDRPQFTYVWGGDLGNTSVEGFAMAVDDAVQVLDFVHGDSNIEFVPGYTPTP